MPEAGVSAGISRTPPDARFVPKRSISFFAANVGLLIRKQALAI